MIEEKSAFVARELLRTMRDTGESRDAAFARMESTLSADMRPAVARLRRSLDENRLGSNAEQDWLHVAMRSLMLVREHGGEMTLSAWQSLEAQYADNRRLSASLTQALLHTFFLTAATALVGAIVGVIYVVFVLPQFDALFASVGAALPAFTSAVLADGRWLVFLLPLIAIVASMFLMPIKIEWTHGRRWRFAPLARNVKLGRKMARHYREQLFIAYASTLISCAVAPRKALATAAKEVNLYADADFDAMQLESANDSFAAALVNADRLDHLAEEIESQRAVRTQQLVQAAERFQIEISFAMRAILYTLIGTLLVAMYLPIFKVGAIA